MSLKNAHKYFFFNEKLNLCENKNIVRNFSRARRQTNNSLEQSRNLNNAIQENNNNNEMSLVQNYNELGSQVMFNRPEIIERPRAICYEFIDFYPSRLYDALANYYMESQQRLPCLINRLNPVLENRLVLLPENENVQNLIANLVNRLDLIGNFGNNYIVYPARAAIAAQINYAFRANEVLHEINQNNIQNDTTFINNIVNDLWNWRYYIGTSTVIVLGVIMFLKFYSSFNKLIEVNSSLVSEYNAGRIQLNNSIQSNSELRTSVSSLTRAVINNSRLLQEANHNENLLEDFDIKSFLIGSLSTLCFYLTSRIKK